MTNAELLELLREARYACESLEFEPCSENRRHALDTKARIDAALAAHRDEVPAQDSAKEVVEFKPRWWPAQQETLVNEACVRVWLQDAENWGWWVFKSLGVRDTGFAKTEDEAKSAAIAAARGL